jgi:hypothetical protein
MVRRRRLLIVIGLTAVSLGLTACVGVLDRCADGLNPPAGGWDRHGPG